MRKWKGYEKGVNLGGWFSQCDYSRERLEHFIEEEDIRKLAGWGLDHLRLPVDYNLVEDENGEYKEEGFSHIKRAIEWCRKYNLNMILDLHKTAGYSFDAGESEEGFFTSKKYQERFYKLWEQFAKRFSSYGDAIAFELLNEVTDEKMADAWNEIAANCVERIRKIAPATKILIGGYWNNSVMAVKDLPLPMDENIVYNFHCYDPLIFTHQGAGWLDGMPLDFRMKFRHTIEEYQTYTKTYLPSSWAMMTVSSQKGELGSNYFEALFAEAIAAAEERNVPLYCGEYGVIEKADAESTVEWYQAIHAVFEKYHIGRAAWSYREMDFGLESQHMEPILSQIISLL